MESANVLLWNSPGRFRNVAPAPLASIDAIPSRLTHYVSLTHRARRQKRKRQIVPLATGGYTSARRAQEYIADGRAWLNEHQQLEFDPKHPRNQKMLPLGCSVPIEDAFLPGYRFHWAAGYSGGVKVMKARGTECQ